MPSLNEAIDSVRAAQASRQAEENVRRQAVEEARAAADRAEQQKSQRILSDCEQVLVGADHVRILSEVNTTVFGGNGSISEMRHRVGPQLSGAGSIDTRYYSTSVSIEGKTVDGSRAYLTISGHIKEEQRRIYGEDSKSTESPWLGVAYAVERVLPKGPKGLMGTKREWGQEASNRVGQRQVDGQEAPENLWENPDVVRDVVAALLVKQRLA